MDVEWYYLALIILFILFASLYTLVKTAFFSADKKRIKEGFSGILISRYINKLLENHQRFSLILLFGKNLFITSASVLLLILSWQYSFNTGFSFLLITIILLIFLAFLFVIFGEIIPKVIASRDPISTLKYSIIPFYWTSIILIPFAEIINELFLFLAGKIKIKKIAIEDLAEIQNDDQITPPGITEERGLMESIVSFRQILVREIMTPRVDITAVPVDSTYNELLEIITSSGHSRIPLYKDNLDDIVGIIYAKDLLPYLKNEEQKKNLSLTKIARKVIFVPETKLINDLLNEFQERKIHLAVVVDEFGGTSGLITMEDIIEEIIGEIRDEYDKEDNPVTKIDENNYLVLGKLSIDELNELLNLNIGSENEDFETVAGLVLNNAGQIPHEGYSFNLNNYKFSVEEVFNKRIQKVKIEKLQGE